MPSEPVLPPRLPAPPAGPWTRRRVLGAGASALGALAAGGVTPWARRPPRPAGAAREGPARLGARSRLPVLESRATQPTGEVQRFRSRPDLAPAKVEVDIDRPGQDPGLIFMDSQGGGAAEGPMVIDGTGELVWFQTVSADPSSLARRAFDLRVQEWKGKPVLTWFDGSVVDSHGQGEDVIMDTSYQVIARVQAKSGCTDDLHEFRLTPQGTALVTCYPLGYGDLRSVGGSSDGAYVYGVVQEIDIATGELVFEWRSDDHVAFDETYAKIGDYRTTPFDYFHVNSIDLDTDGNLVVSARNTWTVYKVERHTGAILWRMGGKRSDFSIGPGAHFAWQHDVSAHPGYFTVFDNGAGDYRTERQSRGLVLDVDERGRRVRLRRQLLHPRGPWQAGALGSVQALPGGHLFVGWGILAGFTEFDSRGTPLLDGRLAGNDPQSYRAFRAAWTAVPAGPPALAAEPSAGGTTLFASWNGATSVAHWLVLGGASPTRLGNLGAAKRAGFETVIDLPRRVAHVAVAALDLKGHELGRSSTVAV